MRNKNPSRNKGLMTTLEVLKTDKDWLEENVKIGTQSNYEMFHNFIEICKTYHINFKKKILERITEGS